MRITVLSFYDRISLFHSLKPFLFSRHKDLFTFTNKPDYCIKKDKNRILFLDRWFLKPDHVDIKLLSQLRDKYRVIFFFNGNAGGGIIRPEVLPYVDRFFNKSLFRDKTLYQKKLYGDELFTDISHKKYGITDPDPCERQVVNDPTMLDKLAISWNIGVGDFPKLKYRQRSAVALARTFGAPVAKLFHKNSVLSPDKIPQNSGQYPVNARWGGPARPTLLHHRTMMLEQIADDPRFLVGKVSQNQYNREIKNSKITLSPFGWGEVCFRDFEAVLNGSLLVKPDMSHLETWPDIFIPGETYVPIEWDGSDLVEKIDFFLNNESALRKVVQNAFENYHEQIKTIDDRMDSILNLIEEY